MTTATASLAPSLDLGRFTPRDGALWALAAAAVISMHVAVAYAVQSLRPMEEDGGAPPALMIELAPIPMAPAIDAPADPLDAMASEQAAATETTETLEEVEPDQTDETVEPLLEAEHSDETDTVAAERVAEEDVAAAAPSPTPERVEMAALSPVEEEVADEVERQAPTEVEEVIPDVIEAVTPEVEVPLPEPRPRVEEVATLKADKPEPARAKKPAAETREVKRKKPAAKAQPAAVAKAETQAPKAAAPRQVESVAAPRVSPAKWHSRVLSWLNRHKRYPASAKSKRQEGLVQVAFTVDQGGRVTSSRVARSSGIPALDEAALDMVRRASPVPAPPPEIATSSMKLAVPVDFSLR